MSPRITRSSARQAASQAARAPAVSSASATTLPESSPPTAPPPSLSRKRKVSSAEKSPATGPQPSSSVRRSKRQKIPEAAVPPSEALNTLSHPTSPRKGKLSVDMDDTELVRSSCSSKMVLILRVGCLLSPSLWIHLLVLILAVEDRLGLKGILPSLKVSLCLTSCVSSLKTKKN
jgi:hypothetical protein